MGFSCSGEGRGKHGTAGIGFVDDEPSTILAENGLLPELLEVGDGDEAATAAAESLAVAEHLQAVAEVLTDGGGHICPEDGVFAGVGS